ncbi:uncharacterized protein CEXT_254841 [Caerostris extrusa]|uniref:Uncharacterized protein n=1 Tax=Caerostris extrusa TaxID=172846 RepID=A0AAV4XBU2_CAEEX|nr:uncharacterized protein CEXT_254841 [Caerostris extrusa]
MFHRYVENKRNKGISLGQRKKTDDPSHEQNGFLMKLKQKKKTPVSTGERERREKKSQSSYTLQQINHFSNATPPLQIRYCVVQFANFHFNDLGMYELFPLKLSENTPEALITNSRETEKEIPFPGRNDQTKSIEIILLQDSGRHQEPNREFFRNRLWYSGAKCYYWIFLFLFLESC